MKAFALQHFSLRVSDLVDLPFVQPWYRDNLRLPKHTRAPITRVARQGSSIPFIQLMQDRIGSGESGREAFSCRESRNDIISPLIANDVSIRVWGGDREETRGREREREKERERDREQEEIRREYARTRVYVRRTERTGYVETLISRGGNIGPMIFEARVLYEAVSLVRDVYVWSR